MKPITIFPAFGRYSDTQSEFIVRFESYDIDGDSYAGTVIDIIRYPECGVDYEVGDFSNDWCHNEFTDTVAVETTLTNPITLTLSGIDVLRITTDNTLYWYGVEIGKDSYQYQNLLAAINVLTYRPSNK